MEPVSASKISMTAEPGEVARPWGAFRTVAFLPSTGSLKLLYVEGRQRLSLQRHAGRAEHWVVLRGNVIAEIDDDEYALSVGDHVHIPCGAWHRLSSPADDGALVAEVQVGGYEDSAVAETDIERKQDDYGRV